MHLQNYLRVSKNYQKNLGIYASHFLVSPQHYLLWHVAHIKVKRVRVESSNDIFPSCISSFVRETKYCGCEGEYGMVKV